MMNWKDWLVLHRAKKDLKNLRNEYRLHEDLLSAEVREEIGRASCRERVSPRV